MINGQMVEWIHGCCFGVREWMQDIETTGAALRCFMDRSALLPEVNITSLQDPLGSSAFTVPELKIAAANKSANPIASGKISSSAVASTGRVSPIAPADLSQVTRNSAAPKGPASNGNWISSADLPMLEVSVKDKVSVPAGKQSGGPVDSIMLSSVLAKIEDIEDLKDSVTPDKSVEGIGFTARVGQLHPVIVARPEAFTTMYESLMKESSRQINDWVSNPFWRMPVSDEQKFSADSASYGRVGLVNFETQDRPMGTRLERETAALDALASAALEAVMPPAAKAFDSTVSGSKPDASQEQNFISALDRLAETLNTLEGRLARSSHAKGAPKDTEQTDSGEILWLEEEELAGKLQTILKRQARRRGIDLS